MRLEITHAQAEDLRAKNAKVIEETRYYAVVADVARDATTSEAPPKARKRRTRTVTNQLVFGHNTVRRTTRSPEFYTKGIAFDIWTAITQFLPTTSTEIRRSKLEEEIQELLPEYSARQVKNGVSLFVSKAALELAA